MAAPKITKAIDEYTFAARAALFCFANAKLCIGTVFFWEAKGITYLITNWHNVAGRNPITGEVLHSSKERPTRFEVSFFLANTVGAFHTQSYRLYDKQGVPLWKVHAEHGRRVDVVALPIRLPKGVSCHPINKLSTADLKVRVGHDLFILGFPFAKSIVDRGGLPIWKRASLASEPDFMIASELYSLVDTASRPGMSGAPVIRRAYAGAELQSGAIQMGGATRFFGVYAGRIVSSDPNDVQLGRVYGRDLLEEIVAKGVRDIEPAPVEPEHQEKLLSLGGLEPGAEIKL